MTLFRSIAAVFALIIGAAMVIAAPSADAAPGITVSRTHGLHGGDVVQVKGRGLPAATSIAVVQCNSISDNPADTPGCYPTTTVTASASGKVSVPVTLADPVYFQEEFGDPVPVYCRADVCHLFLVWTDAAGEQQVLASPVLQFVGAPARIHATPSTGLNNTQLVLVNGSAYGAAGQTVQILEEACFAIIQASGCYGQLPVVTTTVHADGTFSTHYVVQRFLSDGTDCADPDILGACELNVIVLNSAGQPDDSFGVSRIGDPAAFLTFSAVS